MRARVQSAQPWEFSRLDTVAKLQIERKDMGALVYSVIALATIAYLYMLAVTLGF